MSTGQNPRSRLRVVIDANVLISGLNFPGNERQVLEIGRERRIKAYISPFILNEVQGVLQQKFGQSSAEAEENIALVLQWATMLHPNINVAVVERNDKDNRVLECCLESQADYLITGDQRDPLPLSQFHETRTVNARTFLQELAALEYPG
jgi:uncharacterized protein